MFTLTIKSRDYTPQGGRLVTQAEIDALKAKAAKALARGQYQAFDRHQEAISRLLYGARP